MPSAALRAVRVGALAIAAALVLSLAPVPAAGASVPVVVLDGTGWGHGVGLAQWGAAHLARTGRSAHEILGTFYPGAGLAEATGAVRVVVHRPAVATTTLSFPHGGEVRSPLEGLQAPGFPVAVPPGGRVRISFDGAYRAELLVAAQSSAATAYRAGRCPLRILCPPTTEAPTTTSTTSPEPAGTTAPSPPAAGAPAPPPGGGVPGPAAVLSPPASSGPLWAVPAAGGITTVDERGRSYRGVLQATAEGGFRLVNHLDVEQYLRGMAEVPGTWPAAAVQAQAIAARTYALRAVGSGGEMCDDARCQVYVGVGAESAGQDAAVASTARQVLVHGGALAAAVYSAEAGGVTATTAEGFGTPDGTYPYLTSVRYDTDNPFPWRESIALGDVASRLGYPGEVTGVRVGEAGRSGRALTVVLSGSAGDVSVDGRRFASALGLASTRFSATVSATSAQPAPPPLSDGALQAMPEEAAALARRPLHPVSEARLDRPPVDSPVLGAPVPPALDPRRHPATLVAMVLVGGVAAALVRLGLAPRAGLVGPWPRWRLPARRR